MKIAIIIGTSHAAVDAAFALRRNGWEGEIILIGKEKDFPYQKPPLSKDFLSNELQQERLILKPKALFEKNNIEVILNKTVVKINRENKTIETDKNEIFNYHKLIIATGTSVRKLNVEGNDLKNIFYLRSKNDVDQIKQNLKPNAKVLIVGAGYIGLEVAASLKKLNHQITIVEREKNILQRVAGKEIANFLLNQHQQHGVEFKFETSIASYKKENEKTFAVTNNEKLEFDICVIGIGVIVNEELAKNCNLKTDNGIWVDEKCLTEDENIFAIGDCANHFNNFAGKRIRLESVPNAMSQAKVAAANICEKETFYNDVPWFWSNQFNLKLQTVGIFKGYDKTKIKQDSENTIAIFYYKNEKLIACDAINQPKDYMLAKKEITANFA